MGLKDFEAMEVTKGGQVSRQKGLADTEQDTMSSGGCLGLFTVVQNLSLRCTHSMCQIINSTLFLDHVVHHPSLLGSHSELQPQSVP